MLGASALNPFMSVQLSLAKGSKGSSNTQHALHFLRVSPNASSRKFTAMIQCDHYIVSGYSAVENTESQNRLSDPQSGLAYWSKVGQEHPLHYNCSFFDHACGVFSASHLALVRC